MTTLTIKLSDEQVLSLVEQLPPRRKRELFSWLARSEWPEWAKIVAEVEPQARRLAAERGLNWDALSDEERIALVDDIVHEDRTGDSPCAPLKSLPLFHNPVCSRPTFHRILLPARTAWCWSLTNNPRRLTLLIR